MNYKMYKNDKNMKKLKMFQKLNGKEKNQKNSNFFQNIMMMLQINVILITFNNERSK